MGIAIVSVVAACAFWAADAAYNRGIAALYARDARGAIGAYRDAARLDPFEPLYRASLGSALVSAAPMDPNAAPRLLAEARSQFAAAHRLAPADATPYFLEGNAYLEFGARKGRADLAVLSVAAYEKGLPLAPRSVDALGQLGRAYAFDSRWRDALIVWDRALEVKPDNAVVLSYTGRAYEKLGQLTAARERYGAALGIDPKNRLALDGLAGLEPTASPPGAAPR